MSKKTDFWIVNYKENEEADIFSDENEAKAIAYISGATVTKKTIDTDFLILQVLKRVTDLAKEEKIARAACGKITGREDDIATSIFIAGKHYEKEHPSLDLIARIYDASMTITNPDFEGYTSDESQRPAIIKKYLGL